MKSTRNLFGEKINKQKVLTSEKMATSEQLSRMKSLFTWTKCQAEFLIAELKSSEI